MSFSESGLVSIFIEIHAVDVSSGQRGDLIYRIPSRSYVFIKTSHDILRIFSEALSKHRSSTGRVYDAVDVVYSLADGDERTLRMDGNLLVPSKKEGVYKMHYVAREIHREIMQAYRLRSLYPVLSGDSDVRVTPKVVNLSAEIILEDDASIVLFSNVRIYIKGNTSQEFEGLYDLLTGSLRSHVWESKKKSAKAVLSAGDNFRVKVDYTLDNVESVVNSWFSLLGYMCA